MPTLCAFAERGGSRRCGELRSPHAVVAAQNVCADAVANASGAVDASTSDEVTMPLTGMSSDACALSFSFSVSTPNSFANNRAPRCIAPSPCSQQTAVLSHPSTSSEEMPHGTLAKAGSHMEATEDIVGRLLPEVSHAGGVERGTINATVSHEQFSSHHTHENTPPGPIGHSDEQGGTPSSALRGYPALMNMLRMSRAEARTSALDVCTKTCSHTQRCGGQASMKTCSHTQRCGGQAASQYPAIRMTRAEARGTSITCKRECVSHGLGKLDHDKTFSQHTRRNARHFAERPVSHDRCSYEGWVAGNCEPLG